MSHVMVTWIWAGWPPKMSDIGCTGESIVTVWEPVRLNPVAGRVWILSESTGEKVTGPEPPTVPGTQS